MNENENLRTWEDEVDEFIEFLKEHGDFFDNMETEIIPERAEKVERDMEALKEFVDGENLTFETLFGEPFKNNASIIIKGDSLVITDPKAFVKITNNIYGNICFYEDEDGKTTLEISCLGVYKILTEGHENKYLEDEEEIFNDRLENKIILQNENIQNRLLYTFDLLTIKLQEAGIEEDLPMEFLTLAMTMDDIIEDLPGLFGTEIDVDIIDDDKIGFIIREVDLRANDIAGDFELMAHYSDEILIQTIPDDENGRVEMVFVVGINR